MCVDKITKSLLTLTSTAYNTTFLDWNCTNTDGNTNATNLFVCTEERTKEV